MADNDKPYVLHYDAGGYSDGDDEWQGPFLDRDDEHQQQPDYYDCGQGTSPGYSRMPLTEMHDSGFSWNAYRLNSNLKTCWLFVVNHGQKIYGPFHHQADLFGIVFDKVPYDEIDKGQVVYCRFGGITRTWRHKCC